MWYAVVWSQQYYGSSLKCTISQAHYDCYNKLHLHVITHDIWFTYKSNSSLTDLSTGTVFYVSRYIINLVSCTPVSMIIIDAPFIKSCDVFGTIHIYPDTPNIHFAGLSLTVRM